MAVTFRRHAIKGQLRALDAWQKDHQDAMECFDIHEVFEAVVTAYRSMALVINELELRPQLARGTRPLERSFVRGLPVLRDALDRGIRKAKKAGYFERGHWYTLATLEALGRGIKAAIAANQIPRRAKGTVNLDALPPISRSTQD